MKTRIEDVNHSEPTFDRDGYPTEETLSTIREWPIDALADTAAAMDFAGRAWAYPKCWECVEKWTDPDWSSHMMRVYRFSTAGWSGNESIVEAIEANVMLQTLGAWSWQRGGHYEYRFTIQSDIKP